MRTLQRRLSLHTVVLVICVSFGGLAAGPQSTAFDRLLTAYRGGAFNDAVTEFVSWPAGRVSVEASLPADIADDIQAIAAYVLVHTEASARLGTFGRLQVVPAMTVIDMPRSPLAAIEPFSRHALAGVERMLQLRSDDPNWPRWLRDWHIVAASLHRGTSGNQDWSPAHEARLRFPDDPQIWLLEGAVRERLLEVSWGSGFEYLATHVNRAAVSDLIADRFPRNWANNRKGGMYDRFEAQAIEHGYRQALMRDPALTEATLRLGRVLQITDRNREARAHLESLVKATRPDSRFVHYLALLFLGELDETEQEPDAARTRYEQAIAVVPWARTARLALARLEAAQGRLDRAGALAAAVVGQAAGDDPWDLYHQAQRWRLEPLLASLREFVRSQ